MTAVINWKDDEGHYVEHSIGDIITVSGGMPIGIALQNASAGESVSVAISGSTCIGLEIKDIINAKKELKELNAYENPIINLEIRKI